MTKTYIQIFIACWVTVMKMYSFNSFSFLLYKNVTKKKLRIKNVSLFWGGKFRILIQMKTIRLVYK